MGNLLYPQGMSQADYDHVDGSRLDDLYERWLEDNEAELEEEFFADGYLVKDLNTSRWTAFLDRKWAAYLETLPEGGEYDEQWA